MTIFDRDDAVPIHRNAAPYGGAQTNACCVRVCVCLSGREKKMEAKALAEDFEEEVANALLRYMLNIVNF